MNSNTHTTLEDRIVFFLVAMGLATLTYGFFTLIDFLPEKQEVKNIQTDTNTAIKPAPVKTVKAETAFIDPLPNVIIFDTLDNKEVRIKNPETASPASMDEALLKGVARHPDSARLDNNGTIVLFGHSSYLPHVINKNFQAFNGIQKFKWGDTIRLRSSDTEYTYAVERVYQAKATEGEIPVQFDAPRLILVTCNSFAKKEDRFILEASLVSTRRL
jgi:LPXTG-site transpeptidase (sortase) family protein